MKLRATLIVCAVDLLLWAVIIVAMLFSGPELADSGFNLVVGVVVTILLALTALPAFLLHRARRESALALGFALAFPIVFLFLFAFATTLMM